MPDAAKQDSFQRYSAILEARAAEMGAKAFLLGEEVITADVAVDEAGPLTWALAIHADVIGRLLGISPVGANMLPFTMIEDESSPYGNLCVLQKGSIPESFGIQILDAALEHCICTGMRELGYTPEEWMQLPPNQLVISIEPYFNDLQNQWVTDALESNDKAQIVLNLPKLVTRDTLQQQMLSERMATGEATDKPTQSRAITFSSMR